MTAAKRLLGMEKGQSRSGAKNVHDLRKVRVDQLGEDELNMLFEHAE